MVHSFNPREERAESTLAIRRLAKGYSLDDLSIATGLTTAEIAAAEQGASVASHLERIESVLK